MALVLLVIFAIGGSFKVWCRYENGASFGLDFVHKVYHKLWVFNVLHQLYTLADEDYTGVNKYGNTRTATSLSKQVGKERIISMEVYSELLNCRYT